MKFFSLVLAAMMLVVGCGDQSKEAGTGATSADTPAPTGGDMAGQTGGAMKGHNDGASMDGRMMNDMIVKNLGGSDSHYDHRFIGMMIPHHEGAIMMATNALDNANKPELKTMAQAIIASQQSEIAQMKAWRANWYGDNPPSGIANSSEMQTHMQSMNEAMVKKLGHKDADYEDRFIDAMIPHHEEAIKMAGDALGKATHPELKKLGRDIIDAQKREIAQMEQWRKAWYGH